MKFVYPLPKGHLISTLCCTYPNIHCVPFSDTRTPVRPTYPQPAASTHVLFVYACVQSSQALRTMTRRPTQTRSRGGDSTPDATSPSSTGSSTTRRRSPVGRPCRDGCGRIRCIGVPCHDTYGRIHYMEDLVGTRGHGVITCRLLLISFLPCLLPLSPHFLLPCCRCRSG